MFEHRHYEALASWLLDPLDNDDCRELREDLARSLADMLAADNHRFQRARFLKAAGCEVAR